MSAKWAVLLLGIGLLSACGSVPTAPSVLVLPATGKPMDVFQAEDAACRVYAQHQVTVAATTRQSQYDIPYLQCMYSKGNAIPEVVTPGPRAPLPPP
jgi:spermidine/putrescine-binding protein